MMKSVALLLCCAAVALATDILECGGNRAKHSRANDISISSCQESDKQCKLKRRSEVLLEMKFTPSEDIDKLTNRVYAKLLGIPFPFLGVDGTSVCSKVFNADGSKAECPLKANQEYVYKDSFKVLDVYPKVKVDVHWSLSYGRDKSALCFEIPARITS